MNGRAAFLALVTAFYTFGTKKMSVTIDGDSRLEITAGTSHSTPGSALDLWVDDYRFVPTN